MGAVSDGNTIYSYETASALIDRAFRKYQLVKIAKLGDSFLSENVGLTVGSDDDALKVVCIVPKDIYAFVDQDIDPKKDITYKAYLHDGAVRAPLRAGSIVGGVDFYYKGTVVASSPLVVEQDVDANKILSVIDTVKEFFFSRVFLFGFVLSVVLVSIYIYFDAKNKRHKKVGRVTFKKFS
jgi:D-alanyl-D-alanine carboxypeptidase